MRYLNTTQKLALLSLYSDEIKKRLAPIYYWSERAGSLRELVDLNKFDEICLYSSSETEFTENLWNLLMSSPMLAALYETILNYLYPVDEELHSVLCCISENDSRSRFSILLSNLEGFWSHLNVKSTISFFEQLNCYGDVVDRLKGVLGGVEDESTQKRLVLRTIPIIGTNATYDLMRSIHDNSEDAAAFVNKLHPNFLRFYELIAKERHSPRGVVTFCPLDVPIEALLDPSTESKYKINLNYEDFPYSSTQGGNVIGQVLKSIDRRKFEETPILLREYQKELCRSALLGNNTIIAAPTGSGKTVVAAYIIKNHLEKSEHSDRKAKVLFMIPHTVILNQQAACLQKFLGHRYQVFAAHASDSAPLRELIVAKDVVVSTPQLIVNLLEYGEGDDMDPVQTPFDITTFTMVIFDECHNAVKNSPYAVFMRICHRLEFSHRIKCGSSLPQILGLTASFGVGGGSTEKDAVNHVVKLCAILNCTAISTVRENTDEMKRYSPIACDDTLFCNEPSCGFRPLFLERLCGLMKLFEEKLYEICKEFASWNPNSSSPTTDQAEKLYMYEKFTMAPEDKTSQSYLTWVSVHLRRIVPETTFSEETSKRMAIEILEILHDLYRAIELYQDFSTVESFKYLKEQIASKETFLSEFSRSVWMENCKKLEALQSSDNALISELVRQLRLYKDEDFRAIIFVRTRRGASILTCILNSHPDLVSDNLKAEFIAGFTKSSEVVTKREQMDKLKRFREGEARILVATSVADEGLDVVKCNLIIKYNCATNEIAHVQRKGRARAKESKAILITQSAKLRDQEGKNILKGRLMNSVLDAIQGNRIDLPSLVKKAIEELRVNIQNEATLSSQRISAQKSSNILYELLCSKCDAFLCTSKDIKIYKNSQYCVCDPSFWSKTFKEKINDPDAQAKYGGIAKMFCSRPNCGNYLGRVVSIEGRLVPALGATAFVLKFFESSIPTRRAVRKWSNVTKKYFTPDQIRNYDMCAMSNALTPLTFRSDFTSPCLL